MPVPNAPSSTSYDLSEEGEKVVVHGVTVALGALAFVAGVGVEVAAGAVGAAVGKRRGVKGRG